MKKIYLIIITLLHLFVIQTARASEQLLTPAGPEGYSEWAEKPLVGDGIAFSYENGLWGEAFAQGIRAKIPFHRHWSIVVRPLVLHRVGSKTSYRADIGGRLELIGASPLFLNFARIYGGGGVQTFYSVKGQTDPKISFGGGGHFGFEFFGSRKYSFFAEIGGQSGADGGFGAGATVLAGVNWYPWSGVAR